ncbi:hypothetical protein BOTBODRAFT_113985 [Botryobasidium botryosum FD-172 SS1]|uniref:Uncharacterized protein n=1 Tax=Botryobasidium botryosum (strain FD-172 SS1) TaxID=930990 RepID=A0A067MJC0_BOTB1|nr:hypothetical protein BOTBODRAFT_113985 [Botryobasidium botryosum FD-172 SS1]
MSNSCSHGQQQKAVAKARRFSLKLKGVIKPEMRDMVRNSLGDGIAMKNVDGALHSFAKGFGIDLEDSISRRSVGRINREGGVAAGIQVGYEFNKANACTLSNDGTTNKHINYESQHIMMNVPTYAPGSNPDAPLSHEVPPAQRFLGIRSAVNHTSETQLQGWKDTIDSYFSMYNASPFGDEDPLDVRDFARAATGMSTDHAEDQKKQFRLFEEWKSLCEREKRGEEALRSASLDDDVYAILWEEIERNIMEAGGDMGWEALSADEKQKREAEAYRRACVRIGQEKIDAMTPEQRRYIELFLWGGCCMHKEMNSIKGGSARMTAFWKEHGLVGPIKLLNKDNRAAAASGDGATKSRVTEAAQGGAIKLCSLAGAVFAHKDKKKGQQDFIRMLKEKRTFTNMEQNVYDALSDIPTLTELCVLILYSQAISHPYMRDVRGVAFVNLLDLGAKHKEVIDFLDLLLRDRQLLLSPSASYETGSLDGKPWERPEAIYAVQRLAPKLPHLEGALIAFLEGARDTWVRFTSEFAEGGKIATASASKKCCTFMKPTNDANEGALGAYHIDVRNKPRLSVEQHSAHKMYQRNDTSSFMKMCFTPAHHKSIMHQVRDQEAAHLPAQSREKQVAAWERVEEQKHAGDAKRKQRAENKAAKEGPVVRVIDLPGLLVKPPIVSILMGHLNWYRAQGDTSIPKNTSLNRKGLVLDALVAAVERYNMLELEAASAEVAEGAQIEVEADAMQGIEDDFSESKAGDY